MKRQKGSKIERGFRGSWKEKKKRGKLINRREIKEEKRTETERRYGNTKIETEKRKMRDRIRAILNRHRVERKD